MCEAEKLVEELEFEITELREELARAYDDSVKRSEIVDHVRRLGEQHELRALLHGDDPTLMPWREIVRAIENA